jgi:hypothetical protein
VVSAKNVDSSAVLDGFTITGGKSESSDPNNAGGGFYCDGSGAGKNCSPALKNLTFSGITATLGGGMYNDGSNNGSSSPTLENAIFSGNFAVFCGGIFNQGFNSGASNPKLKMVDFLYNSVKNGQGGAM